MGEKKTQAYSNIRKNSYSSILSIAKIDPTEKYPFYGRIIKKNNNNLSLATRVKKVNLF